MEKKFLDFMAGLCMTFGVDWTRDFADDAYCLDSRRVVVAQGGKQQGAQQPAAAVGRAG